MKADEVIFTLDSTFNDKRFGDMTFDEVRAVAFQWIIVKKKCKECRRHREIHAMCHRKTLKCDSDKVRGRLADGYWYRPGLWYFLTHRYEREHLLQGGLILKRLIQWDV